MRRTILLLLLALAAYPQSRKAVLIITDAEGVAGICRQSLTETTSSEHQRLITGEVNAAVRGFSTGGASEVVVWDGHDGSQTLSALTIERSAKLIHGSLGPSMLLERGWAAVAFVGQHARAGRSPAVMAHSYSSLGIQRMTLNGKEVGEIETRAALAGWYGVPVIFLSGDQAAAEDLKAIVPEAETAVVKEAMGYYACMSMSAPDAQALIQDTAHKSLLKLGKIRLYKIDGPVNLEIESTTRSTLSPQVIYPPGVERIGPRTLRYSGKDFMEAWTRYAGR